MMNTAVLLIFFNRPNTFKKVFEIVREAKPSKLYLAQDGPREGKLDDLEGIEECRKIAENVDWCCDVKKNYSEINLGCGMRPQTAISWVLSQEDRTIILEDDCVPDSTFFPYCEELLERYKNDSRICYISGLNHFVTWDCGSADYFFTKTGSIHGWATWKRAWDLYDYYVESSNDGYLMHLIEKEFYYKEALETRKRGWKKAYESKKNHEKLSYWDIQWGFVKYSQNSLVIVPRHNLITNIGVDANSTHTKMDAKDKFIVGKTFVNIPKGSITIPLRHPAAVICDYEYDQKVEKGIYQLSLVNKIKTVIKKTIRRNTK